MEMSKGPKPCSIVERFWSTVVVRKNCWEWSGYSNGNGYGILSVNSRSEGIRYNIYAHRLSWEIYKGHIPEGMWVLHKCDNPACTNPKHLFLGTNKDNMEDCSRKGRQNGRAKARPGILNGNVCLTEKQVREIKSNTVGCTELGRRLGVHKSLISAIRKRRAWKHVS